MVELVECAICGDDVSDSTNTAGGGLEQTCPKCGDFSITGTAAAQVYEISDDRKLSRITGWVYDQNRAGIRPTITSTNLESIISRKVPSVRERAYRILLEAARDRDDLEIDFYFHHPKIYAASYSSTKTDIYVLQKLLHEEGLLENVSASGSAYISPQGLMLLDEIRKDVSTSANAFVAMWFHSQMEVAYSEGIEKALNAAGYDAIRVDKKEHVNKIDDEIIASINDCKFIVADFTDHRGGVYFEAGYAMGLGLPVFWTCRKDDLEKLHFDIRQFNCIDWETPEELFQRLLNRLVAVLGKGPKS